MSVQVSTPRNCTTQSINKFIPQSGSMLSRMIATMGMTTVIPDMDASRPASVDPANIVEAIHDWNATQAFASPAVWNVVGRHCQKSDLQLPTLRKVLSAGAPVPSSVLESMRQVISPNGDIFTPYGATEALPVASISGEEVLTETEVYARRRDERYHYPGDETHRIGQRERSCYPQIPRSSILPMWKL